MNLRKYGPLFVSAGLTITGLLWYERTSKSVRGEDVAECEAAMIERVAVAYLMDGYTPLFASNVLSSAITWHHIYELTMCGARTMAVRDGGNLYEFIGDGYTTEDYNFSDVVWLDADENMPAEDSLLASYDGVFVLDVVAETNWYLSSGSVIQHTSMYYNWLATSSMMVNELIPTAETRRPSGLTRFMPWINGTNMPISTRLNDLNVSSFDAEPVYSNTISDVNWWSKIGIDTNSYLYNCERLQKDGDTLTFSMPTFFALSTNIVFFPSGSHAIPKTLTVSALDGPTNQLCASIITVTSDRNIELMATETIVATDGQDALALNLVLSQRYFDFDEGESDNLLVKMAFQPSGIVVVTPYVTGVGVTIGIGELVFGPNNWNDYQSLSIFSVNDADTLNGAAVVHLPCLGIDHQVAVGVTDDDGLSNEIRTSKPLLVMAKNGADSVDFTMGTAFTNFAMAFNYRISTQNLNEARAVLKNLKRTIYICRPSDLLATNGVFYHVERVDTENESGDGSAPALDGIAFMVNTSLQEPPFLVETNSELPSMWSDSTFAEYHIVSDAESYTDLTDPATYTLTRYASLEYRCRQWNGCKAPYPSEWACASGMVDNISIYAGVHTWSGGGPPAIWKTPYGSISTNGDFDISLISATSQPQTEYTFGLFTSASMQRPNVTNVGGYVVSSSLFEGNGGNGSAKCDYEVRLTKLGDWPLPTALPLFTLGAESLTAPFLETASSSEWLTTGLEDDFDLPYWSYEYEQKVYLDIIVIVVDWKWNHLNDAQVYVPEPYTPEWAQANTNAP